MKYHKAKKICWAIHHGIGKKLNWLPRTILKMEKHRRRINNKTVFQLQKMWDEVDAAKVIK